MATQLKEAGGEKAPAGVQAFIVNLAMALIDNRSFDDDEWVNTLTVPYLSAHMPEGDAKKAGQAFVEACRKEVCSSPVSSAPHMRHLAQRSLAHVLCHMSSQAAQRTACRLEAACGPGWLTALGALTPRWTAG